MNASMPERWIFFRVTLKRYLSDWPVKLAAALTLLNGAVVLSNVLILRIHSRHHPDLVSYLLPFGLYHASRPLAIIFGFALAYLSYHIYRRKLLAWWSVTLILAYVLFLHVAHYDPPTLLAAPVTALVLLILFRRLFVVRANTHNVVQGIRLALVSLGGAVLLGIAGFWFLDQRDFGVNFRLQEAALRTAREFLQVGNADLVPRTYFADQFLDMIRLLGLTSFAFAAYSVFRPLYRIRTVGEERERAARLLERYGNSSLDYFKLWNDKHFFFAADGSGFVAYRLSRGIAIALGEPVTEPACLVAILREFTQFCRERAWTPAFYCVTLTFRIISEQEGYRSVKIGQEAVVDLERFLTETAHRDKEFGRISRKFERDGYSFVRFDPPQTETLLEELRSVSNEWLGYPGRKERNFTVGRHERRYLAGCPIYAVKDGQGRVVAFANAVTSYAPAEATIDLMRYRSDVRNGTMDYLFFNLFRHLSEAGFRRFDFGLSTDATPRSAKQGSLKERILHEVFRSGRRMFSFQGLHHYKKKYEPEWEDRFLVYLWTPTALVKTGMALTAIMKPQ